MDTYLRPCRDDDEVHKLVRIARLVARTGRNARRRGQLDTAEENFLAAREWITLARGEDLPNCGYCGNVGHRTRQCVHPSIDRHAQEERERDTQTQLL